LGEENEDIVHQVRAKLFQFENAGWRERGTGVLKLLVEKENEDDDDEDDADSEVWIMDRCRRTLLTLH